MVVDHPWLVQKTPPLATMLPMINLVIDTVG